MKNVCILHLIVTSTLRLTRVSLKIALLKYFKDNSLRIIEMNI